MRKRARVDGNQSSMTRALLAFGLSVFDIHQMGGGVSDLIVAGYRRQYDRNENLLVEIKNKGKRRQLTEAEERFHAEWQGPVLVAEEPEEVAEWFGLV